MTEPEASALAAKLVAFLATGRPSDRLFRADVFCDFTTPRWRIQVQGVEAIMHLRSQSGHPSDGEVPRWRCDATTRGFVLEFEERWHHGGMAWYARELLRADVEDYEIVELSVYCTGDWDANRCAQHAREVRLLRA